MIDVIDFSPQKRRARRPFYPAISPTLRDCCHFLCLSIMKLYVYVVRKITIKSVSHHVHLAREYTFFVLQNTSRKVQKFSLETRLDTDPTLTTQ